MHKTSKAPLKNLFNEASKLVENTTCIHSKVDSYMCSNRESTHRWGKAPLQE